MKAILLLILMALLYPAVNAQSTFEIKEKTQNIQSLNLNFKFADSINVQTWNKDEVYIKAMVSINNGLHNEHFSFKTNTLSNELLIESDIKDLKKLSKGRKVKDLETGEIIEINNHIEMEIFFEVYIPNNLVLKIESISANINSCHLEKNQKLHTISGDIDFRLPEKAKVNLQMKTITGSMYSNFDLKTDNTEFKHFVSSNINKSLNGGGYKLELETISGDIYLRKIP